MSDSTESGSSRNPLDPDRRFDSTAGSNPDRDLERDPDPAAFREPGRDPDYDPAPDITEGVDSDEGALDQEEGTYVEGDYGNAGVVDEAPVSMTGEGAYTAGNYGNAGVSTEGSYGGGLTEEAREERTQDLTDELAADRTLAGDADAEGEYQEGDYGRAGVNERFRTAEEGAELVEEEPRKGQYPAGDYGEAGTVGKPRPTEYPEEETP
ncbi:hypothetical protein V1639_15200 [Pseudarthrobacter sp. J75]|uniref:hypothetical protein n=1 Tax=unclassified Pseudarthrobacter TaxID=2647000 RepID=UPI002E802DBE|nr:MULTISPECIES: hypothetical protein [unclassified Pseudarthrobacter]MEE2524088.1 hypothetical protein [Pseudarthrobacter sp. J47]MEE2530367.1 hypothetical protein [Pseudarthrobacter sp. J75]